MATLDLQCDCGETFTFEWSGDINEHARCACGARFMLTVTQIAPSMPAE